MLNWEKLRIKFVHDQVAARGIDDPLVLDAMRVVARENFVPDSQREFAYSDCPLPIGHGQTISQPYIVALMIEVLGLRGGEKVLEIGGGSGYAAAVLGEIGGQVFTIERIGPLAETAAANLERAGATNVRMRHADGTEGWAEEAPFDAILVSAGAPAVPQSLMRQLKIGGRLVVPVGGEQRSQQLLRITRLAQDRYDQEDIADVRFVPLIGKEAWDGTHAQRRRRTE
ncbi:MAG: protein-L-isoaspartate(D-aspartate) O-methyltransferase [Hyphomicrobium sp.]|nr:protein-L-isoaspartate(D-aspartate) O-methyltransferase [Hyphomicrobium sp.]